MSTLGSLLTLPLIMWLLGVEALPRP